MSPSHSLIVHSAPTHQIAPGVSSPPFSGQLGTTPLVTSMSTWQRVQGSTRHQSTLSNRKEYCSCFNSLFLFIFYLDTQVAQMLGISSNEKVWKRILFHLGQMNNCLFPLAKHMTFFLKYSIDIDNTAFSYTGHFGAYWGKTRNRHIKWHPNSLRYRKGTTH